MRANPTAPELLPTQGSPTRHPILILLCGLHKAMAIPAPALKVERMRAYESSESGSRRRIASAWDTNPSASANDTPAGPS